jgi:hypothetical protein
MSHDQRLRTARVVRLSIIFACACFFTTMLAAAQNPGQRPPSPMERVRERNLRREAQMESNIMIEALRKEGSKRPGEERKSVPYQLKRDFEHLQTVNNQMMAMTFTNNVLDYKLISESSMEIGKHAARLKSNLPLPEAGKAEPGQSLKDWEEIDRGRLKPALLFLDDLIMRFVTNPVFQKPEVIDLQQSSRAKRDLEAIIKLSGKIRKSAEKFAKAL